ncbi:acetyl-CoA carboxylase biotin carboxylase subunit [bacterium]|nr:acetyl-CoA carboxylase biotin carboxylase subunit [bacterium]
MSRPIKKILIANRGEIAVRIMRACRELGIASVAVYSEVDRLALHVRMADEAYGIGPAPSQESYLVQERLLKAAKSSGADAVHPGYGFLAENPEFAQRVNDAGLIFIGPPPKSMRVMGDKTAARQQMRQAEVPIVPGTETPLKEDAEALEVSRELGLPVLLKAAAGGGGKGMRVVMAESEIASAFRAAQSEAKSAFADDRVYVEKYLQAPRHIEVQILADNHGNIVHLGERECSIQRRHQKVIEEAPSCVLDEAMRQKMGEAAVQAAKACGYQNAGTVEFMLDSQLNFFFLEMNTRLQVEHPVTEMVIGLDLVKEQIRIAGGEELGYDQTDIIWTGHAVESRIYAEDPENNFLPSIGKIEYMTTPDGPGVRVDSGYDAGSELTPYYDPLIAKLITWGRDREEAISRMKRALDEYKIFGVSTSIPFCYDVMQHEKFVAGEFDTHFIEKEYLGAPADEGVDEEEVKIEEIAAIAAAWLENNGRQKQKGVVSRTGHSASHSTSRWKQTGRENQMR